MQRLRLPVKPTGAPVSRGGEIASPVDSFAAFHCDMSFTIDADRWSIIYADSIAQIVFDHIELPTRVDAILTRASSQRLRIGVDYFLLPNESWITDIELVESCPGPRKWRGAVSVEAEKGVRSATVLAMPITLDANRSTDETPPPTERSRKSNMVIEEDRSEILDMATRIPLEGDTFSRRGVEGFSANYFTGTADMSARHTTTSVRRVRLHDERLTRHDPFARSDEAYGANDEAVIDLTDPKPAAAYALDTPYDPRISILLRDGWGPMRPTVDLNSSTGPIPIGISGHVPAIAARDAAKQLVGAAYRVQNGSLPFSASIGPAVVNPFLSELVMGSSTAELTPNAVGIEIDAQTVRNLNFSGIEQLRALRNEGVAITIRRIDAASAHDSFLEAAAARVITVAISDTSRERLAQLIAIANRTNVAVIAESVDSYEDLATVTQAGCRYAQGSLFAFRDLGATL